MSQHKAQGTSIGALLAPVESSPSWSITARVMPTCAWRCCWPWAFWWADTSGRGRAAHSDLWLRRIFALTLVVIGGRMFFSR